MPRPYVEKKIMMMSKMGGITERMTKAGGGRRR
jgi:hypothetical protein